MVRPCLTFNEIKSICVTQYSVNVKAYKELLSFHDANYLLETSRESNVQDGMGREVNGHEENSRLLMKVSTEKNFDLSHAELQRLVTNHLLQDGFVCSRFLLQSNGDYVHCLEKTTEQGSKEKVYIRLLTFLPGSTIKDHLDALDQQRIIRDIGELVAKFHTSMEAFDGEYSVDVPPQPDEPWNLENACLLRDYLLNYQGKKKAILQHAIESFMVNVMQRYQNLPKGIIHGDIHDMNIVVNYHEGQLIDIYPTSQKTTGSEVKSVYGIIDFGNVTRSCFIFDIAAVIRDFMVDVTSVDSLHVPAYFLTGYIKHKMLIKEEFDVLFESIMAGFCQYVILGDHELKEQPDNSYVASGAGPAWTQLQKIHHLSRDSVLESWRVILRENDVDQFIC